MERLKGRDKEKAAEERRQHEEHPRKEEEPRPLPRSLSQAETRHALESKQQEENERLLQMQKQTEQID